MTIVDTVKGAFKLRSRSPLTPTFVTEKVPGQTAPVHEHRLDDGSALPVVDADGTVVAPVAAAQEIEDKIGAPGGIASLDEDGKLPAVQVPSLSIAGGASQFVADEDERLALDVEPPTFVTQLDDLAHLYFLHTAPASDPDNWIALDASIVTSVAGRTGAVILSVDDVDGAFAEDRLGVANGAASLNGSGKLPVSQSPAFSLTDLTDVEITSTPLAGYVLTWNDTAGRWEQRRQSGVGVWSTRPAANLTNTGMFFFATDLNGGTLYRCNGSAWVKVARGVNEVSVGGGGAPAAHAESHHTGGSDELTPEAIGALPAAALTGDPEDLVYTDDSRLADERTPTDGTVTDEKIVEGGLSPESIAGTAVVNDDPRLEAADDLATHESLTTGAHGITGDPAGLIYEGDSRLDDDRDPTAHAASHHSDGSDPIDPADIGAVASSGFVPTPISAIAHETTTTTFSGTSGANATVSYTPPSGGLLLSAAFTLTTQGDGQLLGSKIIATSGKPSSIEFYVQSNFTKSVSYTITAVTATEA